MRTEDEYYLEDGEQISRTYDDMVPPCGAPYGDDDVQRPPHYTVGGFEALDVIKAKLTYEEYIGYCKGSIMKYVMRANYKGKHDQDLAKANFYSEEIVCAVNSRDE